MKPSEPNVTPCRHMEGLLNQAVDGRLRGIAKWYAWAHARRCSGCSAFLRRIEATTLALRAARAASEDDARMDRLRGLLKDVAESDPRATDKPSKN
jgi:hypothetical protein